MARVATWTSKTARLLTQERIIDAKNKRISELEKQVKAQQFIIDRQKDELEQQAPKNRALTEAEKLFKEIGK